MLALRHQLAAAPLERLSFSRAILTGSIKDDFVVFDAEPWRGQLLDPFEAFFELENLAAPAAEKMMVVSFVRPFVARGFPGDFDRDDLAVICERLQRPVNRCDSDGGHLFQGDSQNFGRRQRRFMVSENRLDGPLLLGASVHPANLRHRGRESNARLVGRAGGQLAWLTGTEAGLIPLSKVALKSRALRFSAWPSAKR